ncbi:MAG: hypothetical protein J6C98_03480 [Oscillospiraceae bacterium]|nr:hypothetical protein [Oscillospiraceae bacterium]
MTCVPLTVMWNGECHNHFSDETVLERILREEYGVKHILTGFVGPILGAHTGPGVMGLFHLGLCR